MLMKFLTQGRREVEPYAGKQPGKPLLWEDKQKELKTILDKLADYAKGVVAG